MNSPSRITWALGVAGFLSAGFFPPLLIAKAPPGQKDAAAGIFCLMAGDRAGDKAPDLRSSKVWDSPSIDGVRLRTFWDKIEPEAGRYNWAHLDEGLAQAERSGKAVSFSIGAGMATPAWVYGQGVGKFQFTPPPNPGTGQSPGDMVMPLPWDERFQAEWGKFIRATAERYDGNPRVAYIVMAGFGPLIETFLVKFPQDMARIQAMGGTEKWVSASERIIDLYAAAFKKTPFFIAMGEPIRGREGQEALQKVVQYGLQKYPGRFGVMHCALSVGEAGRFSYKDSVIRSSSEKTPVGVQFIWSTTGRNADRVGGTLGQALDRALKLKAHFVEVYASDCENPASGADLTPASKGLKQNQSLLRPPRP